MSLPARAQPAAAAVREPDAPRDTAPPVPSRRKKSLDELLRTLGNATVNRLATAGEPLAGSARKGLVPSGVAQALSGGLPVARKEDPHEREARHLGRALTVAAPSREGCGCAPAPTGCGCSGPVRQRTDTRRVHPRLAGGPRPRPPGAAPSRHTSPAHGFLGGGQPLDPEVAGHFERRLGTDLSTVRLHTDARAAGSAAALGADAFTIGEHVAFGHGRFDPSSAGGRELLAHELVHVLQQRRGAGTQVMGQESPSIPGPAVGDRLRVLGEHRSGDIVVNAGEQVDVVAERQGLHVRVQLPIPHIHAAEPFDMPLALLEPLDPIERRETSFEVAVLSEADFEAQFGVPAAALPEGQLVSQDQLAALTVPEQSFAGPGAGSGMVFTPMPAYPLPPNAIGIQWTQMQAGHLSIFAETPGGTAQRGFRGTIYGHMTGGSQLNTGIPGAFRNDILYRWLPNQTIVYRPTDANTALEFARELGATRHDQPYNFPPRPGTEGPPCRNCITVPRQQVIQALGQEPVIVQPGQEPVDITRAGRPSAGAPFEPGQAGRGATMREYLAQPDAVFEEQGLRRVRVPNQTIYARGGVVFIKGGGVVLMLYGAVQTTRRVHAAWGTPDQGLVVSQEAGGWIGGLIMGALGSAAAAALVCTPSGPGAFACAAAGFAGGLVFGTVGAVGGARVGEYIHRTVTEGPRAGFMAFPTVYTFFLDMFLDLESLDPEGARIVRGAYAGDPASMDAFMRGFAGIP